MASWFGVMLGDGQLRGQRDEHGLELAEKLIGTEGVSEIRAWIQQASIQDRKGEICASFEVCAWMIQADGRLAEDERDLFEDMLAQSDLEDSLQEALCAALEDLPSLADLEERLLHPVLRELTFGMCWEIARADGEIADVERAFHQGLSTRLGIDAERADELRSLVESRQTLFE